MDPDLFPAFYVNGQTFEKWITFEKMKVNFPNLNLETWPISCSKNSKSQGIALRSIKIQNVFPE